LRLGIDGQERREHVVVEAAEADAAATDALGRREASPTISDMRIKRQVFIARQMKSPGATAGARDAC